MGGILTRESAPLWSPEAWSQARHALAAQVRESAAGPWAEIVRYVRNPTERMALHLAVAIGLVVALAAARRLRRQWAETLEGSPAATSVFDRPYAAALVIALLLVAGPFSSAPPAVRRLLDVLGLAAAIRLTRPAIDPRLSPLLYTLWGLFAVDGLRAGLAGVPVIEQGMLALEMLAGIAVIWYTFSTRSFSIGSFWRLSAHQVETERVAAIRLGVVLVIVVLSVGLVAAAAGYTRLARLLASGVLATALWPSCYTPLSGCWTA